MKRLLLLAAIGVVCHSSDAFAAFSGTSRLSVSFEKLNGIKVGAPVVVDGQLVGTVSKINQPGVNATDDSKLQKNDDKKAEETKSSKVNVELSISEEHRELVRKGTVALIAAPASTTHAQKSRSSVVELIVPAATNVPVAEEGENLLGFSSFEHFWSAGIKTDTTTDPQATKLDDTLRLR